MKKSYIIQIVIDIILIFLGMINYLFPTVINLNVNIIFFIEIAIYSVLNILEYVLDKTRKEPLYLFTISAVAAISSLFLRNFDSNYVLSITLVVWLIMLSIIKINSLEEIYKKYANLFIIKLTAMSVFVLIGILVSINLYYRISTISYMLAFLFISYGFLEFISDFSTYLSKNNKFLKE